MGKFKIKINIEIDECENVNNKNPEEQEDGSFEMVIDESDAISIDKSERALIETTYPAIRKALAEHLSMMSKKKPSKKGKKKI